MAKAAEAEVGTAVAERSGAALAMPDLPKMMELAIDKGLEGVEVLERLVAMMEREQERQAEQAMVEALNAFRSECPGVQKTRAAGDVSQSGTKKGWMYAPLEEIAETIREPLSRHGLSYTWDSEPTENGERETTCTLWHVGGAKRQARVVMPAVDLPKAKPGSAQTIGAALTYGQRYSLMLVLGLSAVEDTDGPRVPNEPDLISDEQAADLQALVDEVEGHPKLPKFYAYFGVESVAGLPAVKYAAAKDALEKMRS